MSVQRFFVVRLTKGLEDASLFNCALKQDRLHIIIISIVATSCRKLVVGTILKSKLETASVAPEVHVSLTNNSFWKTHSNHAR